MPYDLLQVPSFARLADYCGPWCIEPSTFAACWKMALAMDLAAHIQSAPVLPQTSYEIVASKNGKASIAVIRATGLLMKQSSSLGGTSTVGLRRQIRQAVSEESVSGILLVLDSPGGSVAGMHDLGNEIRSATRKKPVWAFVDDLCASAAYFAAASANMIFANAPTALIGSIGTMMTVYDVSTQAEREGIKALVFATGPLKGAGQPGTEVTEEQQSYFQGLIDSAQTHFDDAVKKGRGLSQTALNEVRTGGVFPATVALEKKLIDGIRSIESTIDALGAAK